MRYRIHCSNFVRIFLILVHMCAAKDPLENYTCINGICDTPNLDIIESGYMIGCEDIRKDCKSCKSFHDRHHCPKTCNACSETSYRISKEERFGLYKEDRPVIQELIGGDLGEPQKVISKYRKETLAGVERARKYVKSYPGCELTNTDCSYWAFGPVNECKNNPDFMLYNCAPFCESCHLVTTQ